MANLVAKLKGGDRRSIGRADEVARTAANDLAAFNELFAALLDNDPVVRMRAADALEKATRERTDFLQPWKQQLLQVVATLEGKELRWHVAQMLPRLRLTQSERKEAVATLMGYLDEKSSILKTCAMQALVDIGMQNPEMLEQIRPIIERLTETGTPAMKSRGRKLLEQMRRRA